MTIYDQLSEYCDCQKVNESDVDELVQLVSMYTCWEQHPCENFLMTDRKEVVELPDCLEDCDIFEFEPFYTPFIVDSFTFTMVEINGLKEMSTPITDFVYSETDDIFRLELPLNSCKCGSNRCGCSSTYKLVVTYTAGYEEIPECLLPIFCEMLQYIHEQNECCEECQTCDNESTTQENPYGATISAQLKYYIVRTMTEQYKRQLSLISLCDRPNKVWGFVI